MLYRHILDKISSKFQGILRVFVNFAIFHRFTWNSWLHDRAKYRRFLGVADTNDVIQKIEKTLNNTHTTAQNRTNNSFCNTKKHPKYQKPCHVVKTYHSLCVIWNAKSYIVVANQPKDVKEVSHPLTLSLLTVKCRDIDFTRNAKDLP